jgi:hypothetical protein
VDLEAFERGPAGPEHAGKRAQEGPAQWIVLDSNGEGLEGRGDEGRPLHEDGVIGVFGRPRLELELGQGGQLPHEAQRRQLRLDIVQDGQCHVQLRHASQEPFRQ